MNISKIRALWSLMTGGWAGLAVYILESLNKWLATLDRTKLAQAAIVVKSIANAIDALSPLIPAKYANALKATTAAVSTLAESLADGNITQEELDANIDAIEAAIAAWRERSQVTRVEDCLLAFLFIVFALALTICMCGCAYKGGKVVDGTNLAIGMTIPGTEWSLNLLDYVGGVRVAGNDATAITVTNEVSETNRYFGVVETQRHSRMTATIEPVETNAVVETAK